MRYSTGIDWSGDDGDPDKPGSSKWLVCAGVHIALDDYEGVIRILEKLRTARRLTPDYYFKYKSSSDAIKRAFFEALEIAPLSATVLVVNKSTLHRDWFREVRGPQRIANLVAQLFYEIPNELIADQLVSIDVPTSEGVLLREIRKVVRDRFTGANRTPPKRLRAMQDDRSDGFPIQIADMVAGLIHSECVHGEEFAFANTFRRKLRMVML